LNLITANTTEAERQEAIRKEGLSEAEKILEARDAELLALEAQKQAEQDKIDAAIAGQDALKIQIENLRALEKTLSEQAIAQAELEFKAKEDAAKSYESVLDSIIAKTAQAGGG